MTRIHHIHTRLRHVYEDEPGITAGGLTAPRSAILSGRILPSLQSSVSISDATTSRLRRNMYSQMQPRHDHFIPFIVHSVCLTSDQLDYVHISLPHACGVDRERKKNNLRLNLSGSHERLFTGIGSRSTDRVGSHMCTRIKYAGRHANIRATIRQQRVELQNSSARMRERKVSQETYLA